jgi:hypothetical protein
MHWLWVRGVTLAGALALMPWAATAHAAYKEVHTTGYAMRVHVDEAGASDIEHAISVRVVAGALSSVDLQGVEPAAVVSPEATVSTEDGRRLEAHATLSAPHDGVETASVHVDILEPKGLKRGLYTVTLHYRVDFAATGALVRDGAMWRLGWTSPSMPEGIDTERVVFELPAAPTEPAPVRGDSESGTGDGVLSTLRRTPEKDELELVRLHVPRGEQVTWSARVDPKAFPALRKAETRAAPSPSADAIGFDERQKWGLAAVVGLLFALAVHAKSRRVTALCDASRMAARPVIPLGSGARSLAAGASVGAGALMQMYGSANGGAMLLAVAMVAAAYRPARVSPAMRGPGSWSSLRENDAFSRAPRGGDTLDASTRAGKFGFFVYGLLVAGAAFAMGSAHGIGAATLVVIDALIAVPIFFTGTRKDRPLNLADAPIPMLKPLFRALSSQASALRVVPWARVPAFTSEHDELRLLVLPRASMPGLLGIEVGVAWPRDTAHAAPSPEILVRVQDTSAAAAKLVTLAPRVRSCPGRKLNERVVRMQPPLPTGHATKALVMALSQAFVDRRTRPAPAKWEGLERRLPPADRIRESTSPMSRTHA